VIGQGSSFATASTRASSSWPQILRSPTCIADNWLDAPGETGWVVVTGGPGMGKSAIRPEDVLAPDALVRRHAGYRNRVLMGPSFRADVWTVLEQAPELSVADVARRAACSFATAWQAAQDFRLLREAKIPAS
jgi:hypothetical protein